MQKKGICRRLFNFIMNTLISGGQKRVTNEYGKNGVQEPNGEERVNPKLNDGSDSIVEIQFKKSEELDYVAAKDDKAMEKTDDPWMKKERGFSASTTTKPQVKGKTGVRIQGEGSTGPNIIIPITNSAGEDEMNKKKKMAGNEFPTANFATPIQPDAPKQMLTGLGLNIDEISETFIQNTKERLSKNVSN